MSFFDDLGTTTRHKPSRDRPGGRVAWWTIVAVVVLVAAAYVALAWFAEDLAPRRASVEGVDIGGQDTFQASATLRQQLGKRLAEPVILTHRGQRVTVVPRDAGITIDYPETVRRAGAGETRTPRELWDHYTGDNDTAAVLKVDTAAMSRVLDSVTDRFNTLAVEGTLDFATGRAVPVYGTPGLQVDREATRDLIERALFEPAEVEVPVESRAPYITGPAVQQALRAFGRPAMSAPVQLLIGPAKIVVPQRIVGQALTMIPNEGQLRPRLDVRRLLDLLEPRMTMLGDKPRNASVRVVSGKLITTPAQFGAAWDDHELEQGMLKALIKPSGQRRVALQAAITSPDVDNATVASWGIRERVETAKAALGTLTPAVEKAVADLNNRRIPAGQDLSVDASVPELSRLARGLSRRFGLSVTGSTITNTAAHSVLISTSLTGNTLQMSLWGTSSDRRDPPRTPPPAGR